ncbi:MAG: hypothetical protein R3C68_02840 [Myxococcota bacterium]
MKASSILCLLPALAASPMLKAHTLSYSGGSGLERRANSYDLSFYNPHFLGDESYSEYWDHVFAFDSGHVLYARFVATNLGWGDKKGAVIGTLVNPDGTRHDFRNGREDGKWSWDRTAFHLKVAGHDLRGKYPNYELSLRDKNRPASLELKYTALAEPWQAGRLQPSGKKSFMDDSLLAATAEIRGTLHIKGVGDTALNGIGFVRHTYTNEAEYKLAQEVMLFHTLRKEGVNVIGMSMRASGKYNHQRVGWILVSGPNGHVLEDFQGKVEPLGTPRKDPAIGYWVPQQYRLAGAIDGVIELTDELHRFDILAKVSKFERRIISMFSRPVEYRMRMRYTLSGKALGPQGITGNGLATVSIMDKD